MWLTYVVYSWLVLYVIWAAFIFIGLNKNKAVSKNGIHIPKNIHVIVPFRNEALNIEKIFWSLYNQECDIPCKIWFINDHSEDQGPNILKELIESNTKKEIYLDHLPSNKSGKKAAIMHAIQKTEDTSLIFTTDADCIMSKNWIQNTANFHIEQKAILTAGGVTYSTPKSFLQTWVFMENLSVQAVSMSFIKNNFPVLISAANMLYSKEIFESSRPYDSNMHIGSGDDIFFLHAVKKKLGNKWLEFYEKEPVITKYPENILLYFSQKIRWIQKAKHYKDRDTILLGFYTFVLNALYINALLHGYLFFLFIKILLDLGILIKINHVMLQKKNLYVGMIIYSIIQPFYAITLGIISFITPTHWKGRKVA